MKLSSSFSVKWSIVRRGEVKLVISFLRLKQGVGEVDEGAGQYAMHFVFVSSSVFVFDTQSGRGGYPILKLIFDSLSIDFPLELRAIQEI